MTKKEAVDFLVKTPYKFGHLLGFDKLTQLHNKWMIDMVTGQGDKTLQAHRGSYKTTCVSIALAIIMIIKPADRTMFIRKTDADVKEVIRQVQKILADPKTAAISKAIWGVQLAMTAATATETSTNLSMDAKGTAQLVGIGTGSSLTGKHFDRIFTDDIVNVQDRISKAERERTRLIYQELQNIKNRGGRIFNTGTPWHREDCFELMPNPERWDCYSTGLMDDEMIAHIKAHMVPSLFAANYELQHIAAEDVLFSNPTTGADPALCEQGEAHIDAAYGGGDYTAFTICKRTDGKYYVLGKLYGQHIDDVEDEIIELRKQFNAGRIHCENNADKGYLAKSLRQKGERVNLYHESQNKFYKITSYIKAVWENIVFVEGTDPAYIYQVCDYTESVDHDDAPDSLATMIRFYSRKSETEYKPLYLMK